MSAGRFRAFPGKEAGEYAGEERNAGMTYREWLIGQALAGESTRSNGPALIARNAVASADAVLAILAKELPPC
jgi:hypothetical protein